MIVFYLSILSDAHVVGELALLYTRRALGVVLPPLPSGGKLKAPHQAGHTLVGPVTLKMSNVKCPFCRPDIYSIWTLQCSLASPLL